MPIEEFEVTGAQALQDQRCKGFAALTADRIRAAESCQFSLLPREELARLAADWFEACAKAMLRGNFSAIDQWTRFQSERVAAEGFTLEDILELLRICRNTAIETERWNPDILSEVDEVIHEVLAATNGWKPVQQDNSIEQAGTDSAEFALGEETQERTGERRTFGRNRLQLPIRVRGVGKQRDLQEVHRTLSISRGGLYFVTQGSYEMHQVLRICYPYWTDHGAINREYSAKVVRLDRLPNHSLGVGIEFIGDAEGKN
jgi:PilZ domain